MNENDILQSCLDALTQGATVASCLERYPQLCDESLSILQAAASLSAAKTHLSPTPEFKRRGQINLMQRIAAEQRQSAAAPVAVPVVAAPAAQTGWQRFLAGLGLTKRSFQPIAAALAIVLTLALGSGVVSAAQKALPGSTLYGVKRLSEQTQGLIKQDDIFWQLDLAQNRLDEASQLDEQNQIDAETDVMQDYTETLHTVADLITQSKTIPQPQRIESIVTAQITQIQAIQAREPGLSAAQAVLALLSGAAQQPESVPTVDTQMTVPTLTPERTPIPVLLPQPTLPMPTPQPSVPDMPTLPAPTSVQQPTTPALPTVQPTIPPTMPPAAVPTQPPASPIMPAVPTQAAPTAMPAPTQAPVPTQMPAPTQAPPVPTPRPAPTQAPPAPPMSPPSMPSW